MFVGYVGNQPLFATSQPKGKEIVSGTLTDEINSVSALEFTLPPSNDMAGQIVPHASVIRLESDGTEIFCGTANSVSKNFRGDTVVSCDGMIALMADVIKEPFTASSYEIEGYVAAIVKNYNDGVTSDKEIKVGQVSGFEGQTFSVSHSTECKNIFELLKELRSEKGGYIWASYIGGDVYINYTKTIGSRNSQQIAFGSNLVSIEDQLEVGTLVTRVWPLGKEGLTIASVNDGKAYLQNTDVELRYGRVDKTIQVDSDDPSVVKSYGQAYLTRYATMNNTITLTAVDLHNLDKTISSFEVGDAVRVLSPPHRIDAEMVVNSVSTDLVKLSNSRITLGAKKGSITSVISSGVGYGGSSGFTGGGSGGVAFIVVDNALSLTSTNPVENKVITAALATKADKTALDSKMDKSGGTFTGNVAGKYFTGTWLQTTEATDLGRVPGKIAVLDEFGWVYYRTPTELLADIGAMSGGDYYTKAETDAAIAVRASLSHYGTTMLSTRIDSISKVLAATPYAVKTALDAAKAYADSVVTGSDYVTEQGANDFWTWRKWASGTAELWGIFSTNTLAVTNEWHNVYYGTWMGLAANKAGRKYPFDFVAAPAVTATPYSTTSADFWLLTDNANNIGTPLTHAPAYACVLPTSATITDPQIHYHVIGKYK